MSGRRAVILGPGRMGVEPQASLTPGPSDAVVCTQAAGVCGSDLGMYRGPFPGRLSFPRVPGHEWSGVVESVGDAVRDLAVGDRVVSEEILWCGSCRECRRGLPDHCTTAEEIGFTVDGAFATRLRVPARACHVLPEECSFELGALVEPLSVAYNAVHLATGGVAAGERAVVTGLGPIGLFCALWLRAAGVQVAAVERHSFRRELASGIGIPAVHDLAGIGEVLEEEPDLFVEASGDHRVVGTALGSLRPHGRAVLVGHSSRSAPLDLEPVVLGGLRLAGSCGQVGRNTYAAVLAALRAKVLDPLPVITHRVRLDDLVGVFDRAVEAPDFGKILVTEF